MGGRGSAARPQEEQQYKKRAVQAQPFLLSYKRQDAEMQMIARQPAQLIGTAREPEQGAGTQARTPLAQVCKTLCVGGTPSLGYVGEWKLS